QDERARFARAPDRRRAHHRFDLERMRPRAQSGRRDLGPRSDRRPRLTSHGDLQTTYAQDAKPQTARDATGLVAKVPWLRGSRARTRADAEPACLPALRLS